MAVNSPLPVPANLKPVPGLQLGVSAYSDRYNTSPSTSTAVRIVATHAVYTQAPYEWLSEYTRIRRTATDGVDAVSHAWYLQAARQFKTVTPFLRYEDTNADAHDAEIGAIGQIRGRRRPSSPPCMSAGGREASPSTALARSRSSVRAAMVVWPCCVSPARRSPRSAK